MAEFERQPKQNGDSGSTSRARQRKIRRDRNSSAVSTPAGRPNRRRPSSRSGPSVRERLVATQIKISTPDMPSIPGKLSSTLGKVYRQSGEYIRSGRAALPAKKSASRKASRRTEAYLNATTRAETKRKTGSDNLFTTHKTRRLFDAHAEASPPVMVRGGMGGMAFGRSASARVRKQHIPRRRFDVPLKVTGAEVRLPSVPMFHLGWRAISLLMVVMMAVCLGLIWKAPVFQVQSVQAQGIKRLTTGDLNTVMGTIGASVFTINPNTMEKTIKQAFPELSEVIVKIGLPASVKVEVKERQPVIAWLQEGSEVWVDKEGTSFPPRGNPENALIKVESHGTPPGVITSAPKADSASLPPGTTAPTSATYPELKLTPELVKTIQDLGAKMPADTVLVYDSEHGLGWNDPNGWEVYFGAQDQDMEMKLQVYQTLVDHLQSEGIQPALISVEYVHAPYYRMER